MKYTVFTISIGIERPEQTDIHQMPKNVASDQDLHCLLLIQQC